MSRRHSVGFVLAALVATCAAGWLLMPQRYVEVSNRETGEEYFASRVAPGDTIRLSWTHSIEHTPWVEEYEVADGELALREVKIKSFGAGVDQVASKVENVGGWVVMKGYSRSFPELHFFQSRDVDRKLVVAGREVDLDGQIPQYAPVEVRPAQAPRVVVWLKRF